MIIYKTPKGAKVIIVKCKSDNNRCKIDKKKVQN